MAHAETDSARTARLFLWASDGNVRYRDRVEPAKDSLAQMGERSAPYLAQRLRTSDARERLTLAEIFEKMGKVGTPFIVPYLDSAGEDMPKNAARCLERIKDTAAVIPLLAQMDHPEYSVRSQVATALGKTGDTTSVDSLVNHLYLDTDSDVRKSCAAALGSIRSSRAKRQLIRSLRDSFYGVRQAAVLSLSQLSSPPVELHLAVDWALSEFEDEPMHFMRKPNRPGLIVAMGQSGEESCLKDLHSLMKNPDPMVRGFAVEGLALKDPQESSEAVAKLKQHETDPFVLAQIARFERIVAEKKNEQSKPK